MGGVPYLPSYHVQLETAALAKAIGADVHVYGSLYTGLFLEEHTADLDVTFFTPIDGSDDGHAKTPREQSVAQLRKVHERLLRPDSGYFSTTFVSTGARVPVVKATSAQTGRQIDITFANRHAVENSKLLLQYCQIYPVFVQFVRRVKAWAKAGELVMDPANKDYQQYSPYTWTLMVGFVWKSGVFFPFTQRS